MIPDDEETNPYINYPMQSVCMIISCTRLEFVIGYDYIQDSYRHIPIAGFEGTNNEILVLEGKGLKNISDVWVLHGNEEPFEEWVRIPIYASDKQIKLDVAFEVEMQLSTVGVDDFLPQYQITQQLNSDFADAEMKLIGTKWTPIEVDYGYACDDHFADVNIMLDYFNELRFLSNTLPMDFELFEQESLYPFCLSEQPEQLVS